MSDDRYQPSQERQLFRRRILWAAAFVLLGFAILFSRMAYLQIMLYDQYKGLAEGNRISLEAVPPVRGRIFDRNHIVLADNQPVFVLAITPEKTPSWDGLLTRLSSLFPYKFDTEARDRFANWLKWQKKFNSYVLPFELDETEAARFAARAHQFPGIQLTTQLKRVYPYGEITAHVVGYVGRINEKELKNLDPQRYEGTHVIGKSGIEKQYEDLLMGRPGWRQVETNARGRIVRVLEEQPPVNGQDITLTLDVHLQQKAYALLNARPGAIVALQPETGAVLAMASSPGYDANLFVDGISRYAYTELLNNPDRPLINRPIAGIYPPGSTIKPFVALTALEHGIITPNYRIFDPGYFKYAGHTYRDWKRWGHGHVNVHTAIRDSCDTFFYQISLKMGIDLIHDGLWAFGFGHKTGIDIPGERNGLIPNKAWKQAARGEPWYNGETVIASIGQGYDLATPIQLARATAILANRGTQVIPHLRKAPVSPAGHIEIRDRKNWERVIRAMEAVVHDPHGTAHRTARLIAPYRMAGKTGTAQVKGLRPEEAYDESKIPVHERDHALFIGFAPVKDPQIAISVIVEHGGSGSKAAAPLAAQLAKYWLIRNHIPPQPQREKP